MPATLAYFRAPAIAITRAREICPGAIDDEWIDDVVFRLLRAQERQLSTLENAETNSKSNELPPPSH